MIEDRVEDIESRFAAVSIDLNKGYVHLSCPIKVRLSDFLSSVPKILDVSSRRLLLLLITMIELKLYTCQPFSGFSSMEMGSEGEHPGGLVASRWQA